MEAPASERKVYVRLSRAIMNATVSTIDVIRADPEFAERFPTILPKMRVTQSGALVVERCYGVGFQDLVDVESKRTALKEVRKAGELAQAALGKSRASSYSKIDTSGTNFLFSPDGKIVAWFDPVEVFPTLVPGIRL